MNLLEKIIKHKDGYSGTVKDLSIENDRITVCFDSDKGEVTYQFSLAIKNCLSFIETDCQEEAELQAAIASEVQEKKKTANAIKEKEEEKDPFSIHYKPEKVERSSYQDNSYYGYSKYKREKNSTNLSKGFNAIKSIINNASYDIQQPAIIQEAPDNKEDYVVFQYDKRWDQACYILRYTYAYAFEYYQLYMKMLSEFDNSENLSVLSVGCGAMIDAWALEIASKTKKTNYCIEYMGVDKAKDWKEDYCPETNEIEKREPAFDTCAGLFLMSCDTIDYDAIVFPKSLRDIYINDKEDFNRIKKAFETKPFKKSTICVAFSLTNNPYSNGNDLLLEEDYAKIIELINCLEKQGFIPRKDIIENIESKDNVYYNSGYPEIEDKLKDEADVFTGRSMMMNRCYQRYLVFMLEKE